MLPLSSTKRSFAIILLFVIAVWSIYIYLFIQVRNTSQNVSRINFEAQSLQQEQEAIKSIGSVIKDTEEEVQLIQSYIVTDDDLVGFIEMIESLGGEAGINLAIASVGEDKRENQDFFNFKVTVSGAWKNLYHFLSLVENLPHKTKILRVNFVLASGSGVDEPMGGVREWRGDLEFSVLKVE